MDRRFISSLGIAALVALGAAPARAAEPAAAELVDIFATACLRKFPDDSAVRQYARDKGLAGMPAEQIHRLLGTNPGEGWLQNAARGQYLVTVEMRPFHTCAIRKPDTKAPDFLSTFSQTLGTWAAAQSGAGLKGPSSQVANVRDGGPSQVYVWQLTRRPSVPPETLMAIVSNIQGGTEVRLVRAVGDR
jgi:hypothetical protein